ncbi:hypothetical protein Ahy_B08g094190 [Arachis hypogaea]|uniref:Outer envelope pore protein n=1 Tax=Arachis hypogaea TaxID=3818 RepID=A0A444Y893_ARAHY|nr:hypothetical protein Ahy_B08g094190 [Arachis hypogaea]
MIIAYLALPFAKYKVAATRAAAEDTYHILQKETNTNIILNMDVPGNISTRDFEKMLKKMCKEGAYWGTVAGLYVGTEYGVERIRGKRDWKNAMVGGAVTGAIVSAANNNKKDRVAMDAITGAAVATAAEFINYLT